MKILYGKPVADEIGEILSRDVEALSQRGIRPGLAVVVVGDDPASKAYVARKEKACRKLGIHSVKLELPTETGQAELETQIEKLNADPTIDGVLCQSPLPKHLDERSVTFAIDPQKDVDCFHPINVGKLTSGNPGFMPCTPFGVVWLLQRSGVGLAGREAVVVGRSNIVGRPLSILLSLKEYGATVTLCHSGTRNLQKVCSRADLLVVAVGKPGAIGADCVKPGCVVVDVGINRVPARNEKGFRLTGDVDFDACLHKVSAITPVPGGVGPLTVQMLMHNTINAARLKRGMDFLSLEKNL